MDKRGPLVEQLTGEWLVAAHHKNPAIELQRDADATRMLQAGPAWENAGVALRFPEGSAAHLDETPAGNRRYAPWEANA